MLFSSRISACHAPLSGWYPKNTSVDVTVSATATKPSWAERTNALWAMSTGSTEYTEIEPDASADDSSTSDIMRFIDTSSGYLTSMIFVRVFWALVLTSRKYTP